MSKRDFLVNVSAIRGYPGSRIEVDTSGRIDELKVSGSSVPEDAKVRFHGVIEAMEAGQGVVASGEVSSIWTGLCRRCLGFATGEISEHVREIYEHDAVEGETYALSGDLVDLEPLLRETVMLELPEAPLCSAECAGLCPTCGINRNEGTCDCVQEVGDPRWAALDALRD